jgi:hypothetical protein
MDKELACWIYEDDSNDYYCFDCMQIRLKEANKNKEFAGSIDYENGEECRYMQDYANEDDPVYCCMCETPLYSNVDNDPDEDEPEDEDLEII